MRFKIEKTLGVLTAGLLVSAGSAVSAFAAETSDIVMDGLISHGDGTASYYADGILRTGYFTVTPSVTMGDIDQNSVVDALDSASILTAAAQAGAGDLSAEEILLNGSSLPDLDAVFAYADVATDQLINAADAAEILRYSAIKGSGGEVQPLGFAMYYADNNGILRTGAVVSDDGVQYYADEDFSLHTGWLMLEDGSYYYREDGTLQPEGFAEISGKTYYFRQNGCILQSSWLEADGKIMYLDASGAVVTGWKTIDDYRYYFNGDGAAQTGWQTIDGARYYFADDGVMQTGWLELDGMKYYLSTDGILCTGWQDIHGARYYFADDGAMQTGWLELDGTKYYLGADGVLCTGWLELDGAKYYLGTDGVLCTGWQDIDGVRYYFADDGVLRTGWLELDGVKYYLGNDGILCTGWQTIDEQQYYFNADGTMAVNTTIDGMVIGADGIAVSETLHNITVKAKEILDANGTSVANIYTYMRSTNRYKRIEATKTLAQIEELGWSHFVDYSMKNYYVVCYYMAAKMDFLLRQAGHECRVVYATHGTGDHYWNQVYINGTWVNYDCTNGYNAYTLNQMIAAGNYTILDYLTPEYK